MIVECPSCLSRYDVSGRPPGTKARCHCGSVFVLPASTREAGSLSCPKCGANVDARSHRCQFCEAALLLKACPRCFSRIFHGAKHCNDCGAKVEVAALANPDGSARCLPCPRCASAPAMVARLQGNILLDECPGCHGVWLDREAIERALAERQAPSLHRAVGLGGAQVEGLGVAAEMSSGRMYLKCPECDMIMNRVNFGRRSGIIVDSCKAHGTWFDTNELPRVIEYVSKGGLELTAQAEVERLREATRRNSEMKNRLDVSDDRERQTVSVFGALLKNISSFLLD